METEHRNLHRNNSNIGRIYLDTMRSLVVTPQFTPQFKNELGPQQIMMIHMVFMTCRPYNVSYKACLNY